MPENRDGPCSETWLQQHRGWQLRNGKLWSVRHFPDYAKAVEFLLAVARLAEKQQHHPELKLGYGFVEIEVWTHDVRGLTGKDEALAEAIDHLGLE